MVCTTENRRYQGICPRRRSDRHDDADCCPGGVYGEPLPTPPVVYANHRKLFERKGCVSGTMTYRILRRATVTM